MLPVREALVLAACLACVMGQDLCKKNGTEMIDGIVPDADNQMMIIQGENYWKLDGNLTDGFSLSPGYPKKISTRWSGLNTTFDIVLYDVLSNLTYFISDQQCWAFNDTRLIPGYPRPLRDDPLLGPSNQNDHDELSLKRLSAMGKGYTSIGLYPADLTYVYFFRGTEYTKIRLPDGPMETGYPKSLVPFWFQCPTRVESSK